jgi:hypothetical protein
MYFFIFGNSWLSSFWSVYQNGLIQCLLLKRKLSFCQKFANVVCGDVELFGTKTLFLNCIL